MKYHQIEKKKRNVKVPGDGQCRMGGSESHKNGRKKKEEREQNKKKKNVSINRLSRF